MAQFKGAFGVLLQLAWGCHGGSLVLRHHGQDSIVKSMQ